MVQIPDKNKPFCVAFNLKGMLSEKYGHLKLTEVKSGMISLTNQILFLLLIITTFNIPLPEI